MRDKIALHSSMVLLNPTIKKVRFILTVSLHSSMVLLNRNSTFKPCVFALTLHSSMVLLNLIDVKPFFLFDNPLHSSMVLLNQQTFTNLRAYTKDFTFQYGSIKSVIPQVGWFLQEPLHSSMVLLNLKQYYSTAEGVQYLYIPVWFY